MTTPDESSRPAPNSDSLLVQRCLDGDKRAFDLLVIKYQRRVERLIGRMVRDVDAVPDIAQETFIRAYRALGQYRGDAQFYTWLYRIAVNTAKKRLMVMKRDPLVFAPDKDDEVEDETSGAWREPRGYNADSETPEAVMASREIAQAVNDAMAALPLDLRTAIELRELEGLSYEAIAQAQGCPIGTVRSRIFRAREAISARIQPMLEHQTGKRW
jgi:RNA polymerase sigma-70 factor (ECF subfamily)